MVHSFMKVKSCFTHILHYFIPYLNCQIIKNIISIHFIELYPPVLFSRNLPIEFTNHSAKVLFDRPIKEFDINTLRRFPNVICMS